MKWWFLGASVLAHLVSVLSQQVTNLPLTLYRSTFEAVGPGRSEYFAVTLCEKACAYNKWAVLSIAVPDNPTWELNQPVVVMELSKCKDSFAVGCVFATNYFWGTDIFAQVQWEWAQYLDTTNTFYIRATGPIATLTYSFEIQFKPSGSMKTGYYDQNAFRGAQVPTNTVFNRLKQMVKLQEASQVSNFQTDVFYLQFCPEDFPSGCDKDDFRVIASAMSTADRPMSQFNLYACPWTSGPTCGPYLYTLGDLSTIGVVQVDVYGGGNNNNNNPQKFNISEGMYFSIYGLGGELDQINAYLFSVRLYLS